MAGPAFVCVTAHGSTLCLQASHTGSTTEQFAWSTQSTHALEKLLAILSCQKLKCDVVNLSADSKLINSASELDTLLPYTNHRCALTCIGKTDDCQWLSLLDGCLRTRGFTGVRIRNMLAARLDGSPSAHESKASGEPCDSGSKTEVAATAAATTLAPLAPPRMLAQASSSVGAAPLAQGARKGRGGKKRKGKRATPVPVPNRAEKDASAGSSGVASEKAPLLLAREKMADTAAVAKLDGEVWVMTTHPYLFDIADWVEASLAQRCRVLSVRDVVKDNQVREFNVRNHRYRDDRLYIFLGANNLVQLPQAMPKRYMVYQLEQSKHSHWMQGSEMRLYAGVLSGARLFWDYSRENLRVLAKENNLRGEHVPIGYVDGWRPPRGAADKDIDVVFFGSTHGRRERIFAELRARGFRVVVETQAFGKQRDALIRRAKLALNIHFYAPCLLETARINSLLLEGSLVVSERDERDEAPNELYKDAVVFSTYESLVDTCTTWLAKSEAERSAKAALCYEHFQRNIRMQLPWTAIARELSDMNS